MPQPFDSTATTRHDPYSTFLLLGTEPLSERATLRQLDAELGRSGHEVDRRAKVIELTFSGKGR